MVVSALSDGGRHDPGSGPLPTDLPIVVDLWASDEQSGCWADMTRTFVAGDVVAIEPGIEGLEGIGGVRFEDLLLITDDGCETLTRYAYDL
jgi:Xaa-Pro aminopeptidase